MKHAPAFTCGGGTPEETRSLGETGIVGAASATLRVLVVEDDPDTRANLCDILELDGHEPVSAATAAAALARDDWDAYDAILLDWRLPDASAETLLPQLRALAPDAAIIVSTGVGGLSEAVSAIRHGAADYITKPVDVDLLRASLRNVAERKRLAQEKSRSEAAFRSVVEAAGSLIVILRPDGAIDYMNPFGLQLAGYEIEEIRDRKCVERLIPEAYRPKAAGCIQHVIAGAPERDLEMPLLTRDGEERWVLWNVQPFHNLSGDGALLAVGQDITARKQAEERSLQAERLAAIGKAMAGLAHESRNALQRSQANLELLGLIIGKHPDAQAIVKRIQNAQNDLGRLYEEVREYAAPVRLNAEALPVASVVREAWELLTELRVGRRCELICEGDPGRRCVIDHFQMLQAFRNVLENALAAASDPVVIRVDVMDANLGDEPAIDVSIRDNGPGIPPDKQARIFEEFFTTKSRGTGLGLAIVRRVVEAHGGSVRINPEYALGAEFVFTLPAAPSEPEAAAYEPAAVLTAQRL